MTTIAPAPSRNDPCPCGSGKRYKHCHGGGTPPTVSAPAAAAPPEVFEAEGDPISAARAALRAGAHAQAAAIVEQHHGRTPADLVALKLYAEAIRPSEPVRSRECWELAHLAAPLDPEPLFFLGDFCREAGEHERAIELFEQALALAPDHPALLNNLGLALEKAGRLVDAESRFRRAVEVEPESQNSLANLAQNLYQQWRFREAIPLFDRLVERMPVVPAAIWSHRAICYLQCREPVRAEASLVRALEAVPDNAELWRELGYARIQQAAFGGAALALERAVALHIDDMSAECMLLHAKANEGVWRDIGALRERILGWAKDPPAGRGGAVVPFVLQSICDDAAVEFAATQRWATTRQLPVTAARPPRRASDGRLNLGFLSPELHQHPVGRLIVGLLERLDRRRFRVFAYAPGPAMDDPIRRRIVATADLFRPLPGADVREIADAIRADGVDVAFDLTGYTGISVVDALLLRPAPVQINFLGFTGTLGSPAFDWILTDSYCVPPDAARHYAERPLYVDPCYLPSDPTRTIASEPLSRARYGLPEDGVVFAAQMPPYKILPELFDTWLSILAEVEGSVLWLRRQSAGHDARLAEAARARGIDRGRLVLSPPDPLPRYLARFRLADLFLDSMPFGSHTTVNDALYAGLPAIARAGGSFASRASASQLRAAGLAELVVDDADAYVRLAVSLARDRGRLKSIAARLREDRASLPLFDLDAYARSFEAAIERAWAETPLT